MHKVFSVLPSCIFCVFLPNIRKKKHVFFEIHLIMDFWDFRSSDGFCWNQLRGQTVGFGDL